MRRFIIIMGVLLASMFILSSASADYCSICVKDYCQTSYETNNDLDGDGMNDAYEMQLARQYEPALYLNDSKLTIRKMMDISIRNNFLTYAQNKSEISDSLQSTYKKSEKLKDPKDALFYAVVPGFVVHGAGHFYAGETKTGIALLAAELVGIGFYYAAIGEGLTENIENNSTLYAYVGFGIFMVSWGFDIFRAPVIVMKQNQELQKKQRLNLKLERDSNGIKLKIVKTF